MAIGVAMLGAAALGAIAVGYGVAQPESENIDSTFSPEQEEAIKLMVREYLLENPDVLIASINAYAERERTVAAARAEDVARENLEILLNQDTGVVLGADVAKATVAVIELFDYHCGFCKRATPFIKELTSGDKAIKVVLREFPILRQESELAARAALAARKQGKYSEMHFAMMEASGVLSRDRILDLARKTGLDTSALERDMEDPSILAALDETQNIAAAMGADGTPTFIVASLDGAFVEVIQGARFDDVTKAVKEAKKANRN